MAKIYAKLAAIQAEIHAPKNERNDFGKYNYRTAEAILEAVKPLLKAQGCLLNCTDELLLIGDRYYIKATAVITCVEDGSQVQTTAWAREEEEKKGMDQSQVTGASSSYARKYALNGLLCIDNTPDSDATNDGTGTTSKKKGGKKQEQQPATQQTATPEKAAKKPIPQRGSEEWNKWVNAIVTGWKSKNGRSAQQVFAATYEAEEGVMQDIIGCLEEDAFNYRVENNQPAGRINVNQ